MVLTPGLATVRDGIMPEVYAMTAAYQSTLARLQVTGTEESSITDSVYAGALRALTDRAIRVHNHPDYSDTDLRKALTDVSVMAARWAKSKRQS